MMGYYKQASRSRTSTVVQGLFKGLFWRVALISTTFFLVNTFKQQTVPLLFPHAVQDEPEKKSSR